MYFSERKRILILGVIIGENEIISTVSSRLPGNLVKLLAGNSFFQPRQIKTVRFYPSKTILRASQTPPAPQKGSRIFTGTKKLKPQPRPLLACLRISVKLEWETGFEPLTLSLEGFVSQTAGLGCG
jgi:hypothetical protein